MKKMNTNFIFVIFFWFSTLSCTSKMPNSSKCNLDIETLKEFLGKNSNEIAERYTNCFNLNDS